MTRRVSRRTIYKVKMELRSDGMAHITAEYDEDYLSLRTLHVIKENVEMLIYQYDKKKM